MCKLAYYYHTPSELKDKKIYTHSNQKILIDSLSGYFSDIGFLQHTPLNKTERNELVDVINSSNIEFINLGRHYPVYIRIIYFIFFKWRQIFSILKCYDYLLLRGPSPLIPILLFSQPKKKIIIYLVAEYLKITGKNNNIFKRFLINCYYWFYNYIQFYLIRKRNISICTNSYSIYYDLKKKNFHPSLIFSSTLSQNNFMDQSTKRIINFNKKINILFSGRIASNKGLIELSEAIIKLNLNNLSTDTYHEFRLPEIPKYEFTLHVCGNIEDYVLFNQLKKLFESAQLEDQFIYHGFLKLNENYFSLFKSCDFFVLPSYNEGFPRVLWESMAYRLPIITTDVGSIPYILKHMESAYFIPPYSSDHIVKAVIYLIHNPHIVSLITENAYQIAKSNTIEHSTKKLVDFIKK